MGDSSSSRQAPQPIDKGRNLRIETKKGKQLMERQDDLLRLAALVVGQKEEELNGKLAKASVVGAAISRSSVKSPKGKSGLSPKMRAAKQEVAKKEHERKVLKRRMKKTIKDQPKSSPGDQGPHTQLPPATTKPKKRVAFS